jgi:chromate transporter
VNFSASYLKTSNWPIKRLCWHSQSENWQFMKTGIASSHSTRAGHAPAVLAVFLKLGLTCFGGPIAHLGYFRREFVERRHWLDDETFTDLVGLCQFLPGPASSQVGFSIGLLRAGWLGGLAA